MKRYAAAASLLAVAVSCSCSASNERTGLPFSDGFDRPDTADGLGNGWDMRGRYIDGFPLPAATDGFIKDGKYTYAGNAVVYAARQFRGPVHRMGTRGRWRTAQEGAETTLAMAITPSDKLVVEMVHFAANRGVWELTIRRSDGAFQSVAKGNFRPVLSLGHDYEFEIEATDRTVTVRVPGARITTDVNTSGLIGDRAFWEQYPTAIPAGVVFDFDHVWAG